MHLWCIVSFSSESLSVGVVPEVLHVWIVDHGRLERSIWVQRYGQKFYCPHNHILHVIHTNG